LALLKGIFGWIGRHALLWLLLVAALLAYQGIQATKRVWAEPDEHRANATSLERALATITAKRDAAEEQLAATEQAARSKSVSELKAAIARAQEEKTRLEAQRRSTGQRRLSILLVRADEVVADQSLELEIQLEDRKIAGLRQSLAVAEGRVGAQQLLARARTRLVNAETALANAEKACSAAQSDLAVFRRDHPIQTFLKNDNFDRSVAKRDRACNLKDLQAALGKARQGFTAARQAGAEAAALAQGWATERIDPATGMIEDAIQAERDKADNSLRAQIERKWQEWGMDRIVWKAFVLLLGIIAMPFLIRLLFYFVLAPLAQRRAAIRISVPGGAGVPMPDAERSRTSVAITLNAGEELLVRQDYLQSTPATGSKSTQWFLDWRHPFSSLASGLWFLTRLRGTGEATTISAVRDAFAEVTVVTLPEGCAAVLHPRALAAVVQPEGYPMRIRSHWRLFSLNAWLTLQLRYFVFHGPARLVIKGGRGVRLEPAGSGRVFGQDQLVGFSADLAYAVTRTETFWPYFLGREQLLKDRVLSGEGTLIVEESPMAGRQGAGARRGLEGAFDAALKAVGL